LLKFKFLAPTPTEDEDKYIPKYNRPNEDEYRFDFNARARWMAFLLRFGI
jgi:hypothetical protein